MYILLYGAIQRLPTHLTGSLSFIYPIVAIIVNIVAFGHRLQLAQFLGARPSCRGRGHRPRVVSIPVAARAHGFRRPVARGSGRSLAPP